MDVIKSSIFLFLLFSISFCEECTPFDYPKGANCFDDDENIIVPSDFPSCLVDSETIDLYTNIRDYAFNNNIAKSGSEFNIQFFENNTYLNLTFVSINGGNNNFLGYILNSKDGLIEKVDMWNLMTEFRTNGCISFGDTIQIGPFNEEDRIAFYIRCTSESEYCDPDVLACSDPSFHDECKKQDDEETNINHLSLLPYYDATTHKLFIGFEDCYTESTDNSYNDIVLAFSLPSTVEVPSYPVYGGTDEDENNIEFKCELTDPIDEIEWSSASFGLFKGSDSLSTTTKLKYGWITPKLSDFKDFIDNNQKFVEDKCVILFNSLTDSIISSYGCNSDVKSLELFMRTEHCISIPENVYLLFQKGEVQRIKCINSCTIDKDVELKNGETIYFDNAVVYLKGNLTIQDGATIEISGKSTRIVIINDGVLVINGGNLTYNVEENQLENLNGFNQTIASGNIQYNIDLHVNIIVPDNSDEKYKGEIEDGDTNLFLIFKIEDTSFPWWAILLICISSIIVIFGVFMIVVMKSSKIRNKFLPFR